jgi:hypothetical protein
MIAAMKALPSFLRIPWHPGLFALAPVLAVAANNIDALPWRYVLRPALLSVAGAALLTLILWRLLRDGHKAAILGSLTCLFSLSTPMWHWVTGGAGPTSMRWVWQVLAASVTALFVALFVVLARSQRRLHAITHWVNGIGLVILAMPLATVIRFEAIDAHRPPPSVPLPSTSLVVDPARQLPDIYYIILDGYGRADLLEAYYGYDNSGFVGFLQSQGFLVGSASLSNYSQTTLSLASSLNMSYLDFLTEGLGRCSQSQRALDALIGSSVVRSELEKIGYTSYAFATEYRRSEVEGADVFLTPPLRAATPFEAVLFDRSAFSVLGYRQLIPGVAPIIPGYAAHRAMVEFDLAQLSDLPREPGPKFVFAHLVIPHPPFVLLGDGRPATPTRPYLLRDGNETGLTTQEYVDGYVEQVDFINAVMQNLLVRLQEESTTPPVIILQGDHGPGSRLNWEDPRESDTFERHAILNAVYLAGESDPRLEEDLTPVNTFRIVFNHFFGAAYPILPNKSEFSTWRWPYDFWPVTDVGDGGERSGDPSAPCGGG